MSSILLHLVDHSHQNKQQSISHKRQEYFPGNWAFDRFMILVDEKSTVKQNAPIRSTFCKMSS